MRRINVTGTKRKEKLKKKDMPLAAAKFAFSVASLGATTMLGLRISKITRDQWGKIFEPVTNYVNQYAPPWLKNVPNEATSIRPKHSRIYHYARTYESEAFKNLSEVIQNTAGVSQSAAEQFITNTTLGRAMTTSSSIAEISSMKKVIDNIEDPNIKRLYEQNIMGEAFGSNASTPTIKGMGYSSIEAALLDNPEYIQKYRYALRRNISIYNQASKGNINNEVSNNPLDHADMIRERMYTPMPAGEPYDWSAVRWGNIRIPYSPSRGNNYTAFRDTMHGLKKINVFDVASKYSDLTTLSGGGLNIGSVDARLKSLYSTLEGALKTKYSSAVTTDNFDFALDDAFTINHSLLDYGYGEIGIKFNIIAHNAHPIDINDPTKVRELGKANTRSSFDFELSIGHAYDVDKYSHKVGRTSYVSSLVAKVNKDAMGHDRLEYLNIPARQIDSLLSNVNRLAEAITTGDHKMFNKVIRDAEEIAIAHASLSGGVNYNEHIAKSIVFPDIVKASPFGHLTPRARKSLERKRESLYKSLGSLKLPQSLKLDPNGVKAMSTIYEDIHRKTLLEIRAINERLDNTMSTSDRMATASRMMEEVTGMRDAGYLMDFMDQLPSSYPWLVSGAHPGTTAGISPFGYNLFSHIINPQTQPYQFVNVYDIKPEYQKMSVFRWLHPDDSIDKYFGERDYAVIDRMLDRSKPLLSDRQYRSEWILYAVQDMYPYNQDAAILDRKLMREMISHKVDSGQSSIKIPPNAMILNNNISELLHEVQSGGEIYTTDWLVKMNDPANREKYMLPANSKLYNTSQDSLIARSPDHNVRVVSVSKDKHGNAILNTVRVSSIDDPIRIRSFGGMKTVPILEDINISLPIYGAVKGIAKANLGRKLGSHQVNAMMLMGVFTDAVELRNKMIDDFTRSKGGITASHITDLSRRISKAADKIGAKFDGPRGLLIFNGLGTSTRTDTGYAEHFSETLYNAVKGLDTAVVNEVMKDLGHVYDSTDPIFRLNWEVEGKELRKIFHKEYGLNDQKKADEFLDRFLPAPGKPKWFSAHGNMWGLNLMDRVGLFRQSADEIAKVYNIDKPATMGLPFNSHYGIMLTQKFANIRTKDTSEVFKLAEAFVGTMAAQFGGKQALTEYEKIYRSAIGIGPTTTDRIIRKSEASVLLNAINKNLDAWDSTKFKLEGYTGETRLDDIGLEFNLKGLLNDMSESGVDLEGTKILGSWLELEAPMRLANGEVTNYLYVPDLFRMKVAPTTVQEYNDYYALVPRSFKQILEVATGRAGTDYVAPPVTDSDVVKELKMVRRATRSLDNKMITVNRLAAKYSSGDVSSKILRRESVPNLSGKAPLGGLLGKLYIDIETTGLQHDSLITTIGMNYSDGHRMRQMTLFAHNPSQEKEILKAFAEIASQFDEVLTYNGKNFDIPKLHTRATEHGVRGMNRALNKTIDLMDELPTGENAIASENKTLQSVIKAIYGVEREYDAPGAVMPPLYNEYLKEGNRKERAKILNKILKHNVDDVVELASLHEHLLNSGVSDRRMPGTIKTNDYSEMMQLILESVDMQAKSGSVAYKAYESLISQLFSTHGHFREAVFGGKFPGMQGVISALPPELEKTLALGPMDLGVVKGSKFYDSIKENVTKVLEQKYANESGDKITDDVMKKVTDEWNRIETGEVKYQMLAARHPITGFQAMGIANLKILDIAEQHPELINRLMPSQLLQFALAGDLDYDLIQAFYNGTPQMQEKIQELAKYELYEGSNTFELATKKSGSIQTSSGKLVEIPKVFQLDATDRLGKYNVLIHDIITDEDGQRKIAGYGVASNADSLTKRGLKVMQDEGGNNVVVDASSLVSLAEEYISSGKNSSATMVTKILDSIGEIDGLDSSRVNKLREAVNGIQNSTMEKMLVLQSQKGMVGSATALIGAMNTLAKQELGPGDAARIVGLNHSIVQSFLSAKKIGDGQIHRKLAEYGTFTLSFSHVGSLEDIYANFLKSQMGVGEEVIKDIMSIDRSKRVKLWSATKAERDIWLSTSPQVDSIETFTNILEKVKDAPAGSELAEAGKIFESDILNMNFVDGEIKFVADEVEGLTSRIINRAGLETEHGGDVRPSTITKRKSFWGNLKEPTNVENTQLAEVMGPKWGATVKAGAIGAAMVGGLYLAFNFFRPNQMSMIGEQMGYGGEQWDYFAGRRTELPRNVPIDTTSYTWQAPPYQSQPQKKARVMPYDPILAEKMHEFRQSVRNNVVSQVVTPYFGPPRPTNRTNRVDNRGSSERVRHSARSSMYI